MLTANRDLMQQAREALKGKWGLAVVGNLIYLAVMAVGQFIPLIGHLASLIIGGPLLLGVTTFFLALSRKQEAALSQIFDGLQRFVEALITYLLMALFIFLWSLLLIVPGVMAALSYAMTFFLMAENPGLKGKEALQRSKTLMNGNRWKLFCLFLRFFGWFLLGALTHGHRVSCGSCPICRPPWPAFMMTCWEIAAPPPNRAPGPEHRSHRVLLKTPRNRPSARNRPKPLCPPNLRNRPITPERPSASVAIPRSRIRRRNSARLVDFP